MLGSLCCSVRQAGNYGWPYCIGDNKAYVDYDFATGASGPSFDCDAPTNDSPNNTGSQALPPSVPAMIWYPYAPSSQFPELGEGNRTAMAGPFYHFDPTLESETKIPIEFDNSLFVYDWSRNWVKELKFDGAGNLLSINPFLSGVSFDSPIDMEVGPEGAL